VHDYCEANPQAFAAYLILWPGLAQAEERSSKSCASCLDKAEKKMTARRPEDWSWTSLNGREMLGLTVPPTLPPNPK